MIAVETGHVATHETGAIEAGGHKVLTLRSTDGKLTARQVHEYARYYQANPAQEHLVQPGMVYISHPSELGTAEAAFLNNMVGFELSLYKKRTNDMLLYLPVLPGRRMRTRVGRSVY